MSDFIKLEDAAVACEAYRNAGIDSVKGYFVSKKDLLEIFKQDDKIDGIRLYMAIEENEGEQIRLGCVTGTIEGDDFLVPKPGEPVPIVPLKIAVARPCPSNCGGNNQLNS